MALAGLTLIAAAINDLRSLRIPNYLVGILATLAIINALWVGSWNALGWIGALGALIVGLVLWKMGSMGAGDVKLASACLLWLPGRVIEFLFLMAIFGGVLAIVYIVAGRVKKKKFDQIPYGVPLAVAALFILTWNVIKT
jgi:prepilin peptidase CpaA